MSFKLPKDKQSTARKAQQPERGSAPTKLPVVKTQHTTINVEAHLVIREVRYLIVALVLLISLVARVAFGS